MVYVSAYWFAMRSTPSIRIWTLKWISKPTDFPDRRRYESNSAVWMGMTSSTAFSSTMTASWTRRSTR